MLGFEDGVKSSEHVDVPEDLKLRTVYSDQDIHLKCCAHEIPELWARYRSSFSFLFFVRTFTELRKATVSFVVSLCLSVFSKILVTNSSFTKI